MLVTNLGLQATSLKALAVCLGALATSLKLQAQSLGTHTITIQQAAEKQDILWECCWCARKS
jgi:hypothetical protein